MLRREPPLARWLLTQLEDDGREGAHQVVRRFAQTIASTSRWFVIGLFQRLAEGVDSREHSLSDSPIDPGAMLCHLPPR